VVEARRASAHVVAFVRDADDDPERPTVIDAAIAKAKQTFPEVNVIGGAAVPVLEGWMLALLGAQGTQQLRKAAAQSKLAEMGVPSKNTRAMVEVVSNSDLDRVPTDAESLGKWLALARAALPRPGSHA
jgi:hypothetical protein